MRFVTLLLLHSMAFGQSKVSYKAKVVSLPSSQFARITSIKECWLKGGPKTCRNCCKGLDSPAKPVSYTLGAAYQNLTAMPGDTQIFLRDEALGSWTENEVPLVTRPFNVSDLQLLSAENPIAECLKKCPN